MQQQEQLNLDYDQSKLLEKVEELFCANLCLFSTHLQTLKGGKQYLQTMPLTLKQMWLRELEVIEQNAFSRNLPPGYNGESFEWILRVTPPIADAKILLDWTLEPNFQKKYNFAATAIFACIHYYYYRGIFKKFVKSLMDDQVLPQSQQSSEQSTMQVLMTDVSQLKEDKQLVMQKLSELYEEVSYLTDQVNLLQQEQPVKRNK